MCERFLVPSIMQSNLCSVQIFEPWLRRSKDDYKVGLVKKWETVRNRQLSVHQVVRHHQLVRRKE